MQASADDMALRSHLSALLPRLRRFAVMLAGETEAGDALLRESCLAMLGEGAPEPGSLALDQWALARVHATWMADLREGRAVRDDARADEEELLLRLDEWGAEGLEAPELAHYIAGLPPSQRAAVLLVYGERLTYGEAARVLDIEPATVAARATRALSDLVAGLGLEAGEPAAAADEEPVPA